MNESIIVVKIGGHIIDDDARLYGFIRAFAGIPGKKILVHGGGKIASKIGSKLGIAPNHVNGRRVTDTETLELVTMVYGGLINKGIVGRLQSAGCNAIGLSGCDGNVVTGTRRPVKDVDYGMVGDLNGQSINVPFLFSLLEQNIVPVIAPLSFNAAEGLLNTNADTIANEIAKALSPKAKVQLVYCFEKKGLLTGTDDASVVPSIDEADFRKYVAEGIVTDGMVPKLENAFSAITQGVTSVTIGSAEDLLQLIAGTAGTLIK